ncbi:MAG TPA: TetR family transcriptional regulator [Micromonosporaceae bacterium]|nr:TetR family transcriptional regulator [Micromonosporaceae bacterium]
MARLSRAQQQARTRNTVLAAAREEFATRGFRDTRIDDIADRAELTRGAVYSNFPSKRALYFAVLTDLVERAEPPADLPAPAGTPAQALGALARAWIGRLPLTQDDHGPSRLPTGALAEAITDDRTRLPFAQLTSLNAILLAIALENLETRTPRRRRVRTAEIALTMLHGADQMATVAPGFGDPFDLVRVCEELARLDLDDAWLPTYLPYTDPAQPDDQPWTPPEAVDVVRGGPAWLGADGVVAVLGTHRLSAVEEAVRAARPSDALTAVVVTADPDEVMPLAQWAITDVVSCLRRAFPPAAWPRLRVVLDHRGAVAAAAGLPKVSDRTETGVRVRAGRIIARATGPGASHAAATYAVR